MRNLHHTVILSSLQTLAIWPCAMIVSRRPNVMAAPTTKSTEPPTRGKDGERPVPLPESSISPHMHAKEEENHPHSIRHPPEHGPLDTPGRVHDRWNFGHEGSSLSSESVPFRATAWSRLARTNKCGWLERSCRCIQWLPQASGVARSLPSCRRQELGCHHSCR